MSRSRLPHWPEFRQQMVELMRAGRSPEKLGGDFGPSAQAIRNWAALGTKTTVAGAID